MAEDLKGVEFDWEEHNIFDWFDANPDPAVAQRAATKRDAKKRYKAKRRVRKAEAKQGVSK